MFHEVLITNHLKPSNDNIRKLHFGGLCIYVFHMILTSNTDYFSKQQ
jgi:hypothetical protein